MRAAVDCHQKWFGRCGAVLERAALAVAAGAGSSWAFALAVGSVVVWAAGGTVLHFSDTWQLTINTGTTIVTFLMVFLIQRAQNKDSAAIHLKLNEIVAGIDGASNRLINVEELPEAQVRALAKRYRVIVAQAEGDEVSRPTASHSIEETLGGRVNRPPSTAP